MGRGCVEEDAGAAMPWLWLSCMAPGSAPPALTCPCTAIEHGLETTPSYDFQAVWPWEVLNPSETLILPTPRLATYPSFWLVSTSPSSQVLGLQHLPLPHSESQEPF